eukprot:9229183-Alexandrium_andersonii.AAC.1
MAPCLNVRLVFLLLLGAGCRGRGRGARAARGLMPATEAALPCCCRWRPLRWPLPHRAAPPSRRVTSSGRTP